VVILGPDEVAGNQVTVRNLRLKEQQTVKRSEAIELINKWMVK
jgi:histidyl-tRNA synthetase